MKTTQVMNYSLVAFLSVLPLGCHREAATPSPPPAEAAGTIHIERVKEAEEVLAQLGRKAWVFKHRGGELTADFVMYHKPAGTNQQEKVIFEANGDVAVHIRQGRSDTPHTNDDTAGYLIVAMPADSLSAPTDDKIAFRFNLGGAGCGRTVPATDVYPETVLAPHSYGGWSGSLLANLADKLHASLGMDAVLSVSGEAAATFVGAALGPDVLHGFLLGDFLVVIFRWTTSVADATSGPAARNELVLPTGGVGARWYRLHQENRF